MFVKRSLLETLRKSLSRFPVVGLIGCRQVGKTTLAKVLASSFRPDAVYLDLELPSDLAKLEEPELYLAPLHDRLIIIDEIQRVPTLFPVLRALVDQDRRPSRFLILGSASPTLVRQASESLAGRIIYHELMPFGLQEVGQDDLEKLWIRGGLPESYLAEDDLRSFEWRQAFITTYLERDIPGLGLRISFSRLRRFWIMLAHMHGALWNASKIAAGLGLTAPSVRHYLDILEDTFIVRQLQPYYANIRKRIVKAPKVYIRDSGILHSLLGISNKDALLSNPILGSSWEGFILEELVKLQPESNFFYFRTHAGAEIDILIQKRNGDLWAIEVKYSLKPKPSKGFYYSIKELRCQKAFVIYPGQERFNVADNIEAFPVANLHCLKE